MSTLQKIDTRRRVTVGAIAAASILAIPRFARSTTVPVLGLTLPMVGVQSEVATDLYEGYKLAAASSGGAFALAVLDDGSQVERTEANVRTLAGRADVVAISGIVGTPHAVAALPVAVQAGLPVVGIRSGADSLRTHEPTVFHLRSSYDDELVRLAAVLKGGSMDFVQVLYSDDLFGIGALESLKRAAAANGLTISNAVPMSRNGENLAKATQQLADNVRSIEKFSAVVLLLINKPMMQAAEMLRTNHHIVVPIFAMSFVANRALATETRDSLSGLGLTIAFPLPRTNISSVGQAFREQVVKQGKEGMLESLTAFEGFFYGSVFAASLQNRGVNRDQVTNRLKQGVAVGDTRVAFNGLNVGYRFVEVVYKSAFAGRLKR